MNRKTKKFKKNKKQKMTSSSVGPAVLWGVVFTYFLTVSLFFLRPLKSVFFSDQTRDTWESSAVKAEIMVNARARARLDGPRVLPALALFRLRLRWWLQLALPYFLIAIEWLQLSAFSFSVDVPWWDLGLSPPLRFNFLVRFFSFPKLDLKALRVSIDWHTILAAFTQDWAALLSLLLTDHCPSAHPNFHQNFHPNFHQNHQNHQHCAPKQVSLPSVSVPVLVFLVLLALNICVVLSLFWFYYKADKLGAFESFGKKGIEATRRMMDKMFDEQSGPAIRKAMADAGMSKEETDKMVENSKAQMMAGMESQYSRSFVWKQTFAIVWAMFCRSAVVQLVLEVTFIPSLRSAADMLTCDSGTGLLRADPRFVCWAGAHRGLAALAVGLLVLVYTLFLGFSTSSPHNKIKQTNKVVFLPRSIVLVAMAKALTAVVATVVSQWVKTQLGLQAAAAALLLVDSVFSQPALGFTRKPVGACRSASFAAVLLSSGVALWIVSAGAGGAKVPTLVYLGGVLIAAALGFACCWAVGKRKGLRVVGKADTVAMVASDPKDERTERMVMMALYQALLAGSYGDAAGLREICSRPGFLEALCAKFKSRGRNKDQMDMLFSYFPLCTNAVAQDAETRASLAALLSSPDPAVADAAAFAVAYCAQDHTMHRINEVGAEGDTVAADFQRKAAQKNLEIIAWLGSTVVPELTRGRARLESAAESIALIQERSPSLKVVEDHNNRPPMVKIAKEEAVATETGTEMTKDEEDDDDDEASGTAMSEVYEYSS